MTRREIKILLVMVNVFAILSAILLAFRFIQPISFLLFSGLWLVLMLVLWRILPASIYRKSSTFQDDFILTITDSGIDLENERGRQHWQWAQFSKLVETPYFFHLYFDERSFFLIPKDAFESLTDQQEARTEMRAHIPQR